MVIEDNKNEKQAQKQESLKYVEEKVMQGKKNP